MTQRLALLGALAIVVAAIVLARSAADVTPTSDTAVIESFTGLAASGQLALGPYSRYQWHHPGPLAFYTLAPFYVLSGHRTVGLHAGALVINLAGVAAALGFVWRRGSAMLGAGVAVALAMLALRVPELLVSPWNPHLLVIPTLAMLLSAAAATTADAAGVIAAVFFASFAAQTHVALLPLAVAAGLASTAGFALSSLYAQKPPAPDASRVTRMVRTLAVADALTLLLWAPPLVESIAGSERNLAQLWTYFVNQSHPTPAFSVALSVWSDMLTGPLRPDFYLAHGWPFVESPVRWAEMVSLLEMVVLAVSCALAWREQRRFDASLSGGLLLASSIALIALTRGDREVFDHVAFWIVAIGTLNLAVLLAAIGRLAAGRSQGAVGPALVPVACATAFTVSMWAGMTQLNHEVARAASPDVEQAAAADLASALIRVITERQLDRPVIRFDQEAWGMAAGVVVHLQRRGVPVAVEDDWLAMYTPAFRAAGGERAQIAVVGRARHLRMPASSTDSVIASSGDLLFAHLLTP